MTRNKIYITASKVKPLPYDHENKLVQFSFLGCFFNSPTLFYMAFFTSSTSSAALIRGVNWSVQRSFVLFTMENGLKKMFKLKRDHGHAHECPIVFNLSYTGINSLSVGLKGLRKLISMDLEFTSLTSIDGIGTSLPNLQVLKLYKSNLSLDERSIEELQL